MLSVLFPLFELVSVLKDVTALTAHCVKQAAETAGDRELRKAESGVSEGGRAVLLHPVISASSTAG